MALTEGKPYRGSDGKWYQDMSSQSSGGTGRSWTVEVQDPNKPIFAQGLDDASKWAASALSLAQSMLTSGTGKVKTGNGKNTSAAPAPASPGSPALTVDLDSIQSSLSGVDSSVYARNAESMFGLLSEGGTQEDKDRSDALLRQMGTVASQMLRGEIPADVEQQVRRRSAEGTLFRGLGSGSPAGRALTARDLGTTSMNIQQTGMAAGETVVKLSEARREFDKQYRLNVANFGDQVRRTDLSALQLIENSRQFNVAQRMNAMDLARTTLGAYHELAYNYGANPDANQATGQAMARDYIGLMSTIRSAIR